MRRNSLVNRFLKFTCEQRRAWLSVCASSRIIMTKATTSGAQTSIQNEALSAAMSLLNRVPNASAYPVTSQVRVQLKGKTQLQLARTSIDITVLTTIPANNEGEGVLMVDGKRFGDLSAALGKGNVGLRLTPATLTVWNSQTSAEFRGTSDQTFPRLDVSKAATVVQMAPQPLRKAIAQVNFAAGSPQESREFAAVNWRFAERQLALAATNKIRLSEAKAPLVDPVSTPCQALVPIIAMKLIEHALSDVTEGVEIALIEGRMTVTAGTTVIHAQLYGERFVDYAQHIPKVCCQLQISREALIKALKSVMIFNEQVDMQLAPERMEISAVGTEIGTGMGVVDVRDFKGDSQRIRTNARLLLQPLEAMDTETVNLGSAGPRGAIMLKPNGGSDGITSLHLVMPLVGPHAPVTAVSAAQPTPASSGTINISTTEPVVADAHAAVTAA
jgi:DNA polymerase III sliding clamp (beta) subunit (PCNA family)